MSADYPSASASGAAPINTAATIPGLTGTGGGGVDTHSGGDDGDSSSGTSSASGTPSTGGSSGFSQGTGSSGSGSSSSADKVGANQERVLKGSVFAGIVAVVGMMAL